MQSCQRLSKRGVIVFLLICFVAFDLFSLLRMHPVNASLPINEMHTHGDLDRRVTRLMNLATDLAAADFWETRGHFIFHGRNPGLFMFIVEAYVRLGFQSPVPLQICMVLLFNIGLIALFFWVRQLWHNDIVAIVAVVFLITSPYLLYHGTSLHSDPYDFCFFNLTILGYLRYLRTARRAWLLAAAAAYFILCSSYWMFYVSTFLMLIGLHLHERKPVRAKSLLVMAAAPAVAATLTLLNVIWMYNGFEAGIHRLLDILVARSIDERIEGSTWHPQKRFVRDLSLSSYLRVTNARVSAFFYVGVAQYLVLLGAALAMARRGTRSGYRIFLLMVPAAVSWNIAMFQHTVIHKFAGIYGFFAWAVITGIFVAELVDFAWRRLSAWRRPALVAVVLLPPLYSYWWPSFITNYFDNLTLYVKNLSPEETE